MGNKTRKPGEEFFSGFYAKNYRVVEVKNGNCTGCDFYINGKCTGILDETGDCKSKYREDKTNVVFRTVI